MLPGTAPNSAIRPSSVRTCATVLLSKDVNTKIVSEMLVHSSISITLDIYSHLLLDMQESAVRARRRFEVKAADKEGQSPPSSSSFARWHETHTQR